MRLPKDAAKLASAHLRTVDAGMPGLLEGLYLTGSVALGDYRPGSSDVDFVAVISRGLKSVEHGALARIHANLGEIATASYDGVYVERGRLADPPMKGQVAPHSLGGRYRRAERCFQLSPITWVELQLHGIPIRGDASARLFPAPDSDVVKRWLVRNLEDYWLDLASKIDVSFSGRDGALAPADSVVWATLGPGRLHYTLATGEVTSKTGAGHYIAERFPPWRALARRCVLAHAGEAIDFTRKDYRDCAVLIRHVVADAVALGQTATP